MTETKFKETEIGMIPEDWEIKPLGLLLDLLKDGSHNPPKRHLTGIRFIAGASDLTYRNIDFSHCTYITEEDYNKMHRYYKIKTNDVLLTIVGTVGNVAVVKEQDLPFSMQRSIAIMRCNSHLHYEFLFYWLTSPTFKNLISSRINPTAQPGIYLGAIAKLLTPVPNLKEQQLIANILSKLDCEIELTQQMNKTLQTMGQALFNHWLINFEFPDEKGKPYKSSGGEMIESELGEIPRGWKIWTIDDLTEKFTTGLNPRKNFVLGKGDNFYVTIKNMGNQIVILDDKCDKIDDEAIKKINARSKLEKDDILFSGIGTIGRTFYVDETPTNWNISESVFTLRAKKEVITPAILYNLLLSPNFQRYSVQLASGSVQKGIRMADLKKYKVALPPIHIQSKFTLTLNVILKQFKSNIRQIECLTQIRDSLLPKLMSGQIRVKV
ncbi:MAG: restriction endonuclease subunit S [Candidatus Nanoarchaeia archaeon]